MSHPAEKSKSYFIHSKYFECHHCGTKLKYKKNIIKHLWLQHSNYKRFDCFKCGKVFSHQYSLTRHTINVHLKQENSESNLCAIENFDCVKCGKLFSCRYNLTRHTKNIHSKKKCPKSSFYHSKYYECHHCGVKLKYRKNIIKHLSTKHSNKRFDCIMCDQLFSSQYNLFRHIKNIHLGKIFSISNLYHAEYFECDYCGVKLKYKQNISKHLLTKHSNDKQFNCVKCNKVFSSRYNLSRHTNNVHLKNGFSESNLCHVEYYECSECGMKFSRKIYLKRHLFHRHAENKFVLCDKKTQTCALCEYSSSRKIDIQRHYKVYHQVPLTEKQLNFKNYEEFLTWKMSVEEESNSRFIIRNTSKGKLHTKIVFYCHRSGIKKLKYVDRKRRLKLIGSKKIGSICPAEIRIRYKSIDSVCVVSFCDTHLGHDLSDIREVGTLFLHRKDRAQLAGEIAAGVSLNKIVDNYQNDDIFENYLLPNLKRSDFVSYKDLHNIISSYNVKPSDNESCSFSNNIENVESFVKKYESYILYYKKQHEVPSDNRFPALNKKDFVIIFMCNSQKSLLQKHGNNVITIDSTHDLNPFGLSLQTMLILDYDGEDYPVAFAISNCNDVVTDIFLSCVKSAVGVIRPKTLMTDMQMMYFNSWQKIMMIPQYHIFNIWHVLEAWKRNGKIIVHERKRKQILDKLYQLVSEINVETFFTYLYELLNSADDDTAKFLDYFRTEYGKNFESWAYCYRLNAALCTNLHLEAFCSSLKYICGKWKKINNLCSGLEFILNYLRRGLNRINIKYTHRNITSKLKRLRETHDRVSKVLAESNTIQVIKTENGWSVESLEESDNLVQEVNFVERICEKCPTTEDNDYQKCNLMCSECGACAHLYRCTCTENIIRNNMCKHIHIALTFSNKN